MAINLLAIISIVFVIFAAAIVVLFVLHFKHKKSTAVESLKAQVATNAEDVSNLQTSVSSNTTNLKGMSTNITTDKITLGPWSIGHAEGSQKSPGNDELQFCGRGIVRMFLKNSTKPKSATDFQTQLFMPSLTSKQPGPQGFWAPFGKTMGKCGVFV